MFFSGKRFILHSKTGRLAAQLLAVVAVVFSLSGCDADYKAEPDPGLVVEGWIAQDDFPVVILTRTLAISDQYQPMDSLSKYVVKWAKVTVSDGEQSVVLTGKYTNGYLPPYIYTTGRMKGRVGKTYTLTVECDGKTATATTTIPPATPIRGVRKTPVEGRPDRYRLSIAIDPPADKEACYQLFVRSGEDSRQYMASYMGSFKASQIQADSWVMVYRDHPMGENEYEPSFLATEPVAVKLARVDQVAYQFWDDYSKHLSLSSIHFFASYSNIRSNVRGATGCWYGMGQDVRYLLP